MDTASAAVRRAGVSLLVIICCAMVGTQTNYFVVGNTHLIAVLAPITACALLYGTLSATLVGAIAGAAELIHALFLPLDAYEMYFASPVNSVVLFALIGLVTGLMFAKASRHTYQHQWQAFLSLVAACAIGSALFTFLFSVSVNIINALMHLEVPHEIIADFTGNTEVVSQIIANFILMSAMSVGGGAAYELYAKRMGEQTLRETFQGWLAVVIGAAYLLTAALGYTAVSASCRASAERQMQGEIEYLIGQLTERDNLLEGIQRRTHLSDSKMEELHTSSIAGIASGLHVGEHDLVAIADNDIIVSASDDTYLGKSFVDVIGAGLVNGFDESLFEQTRSTQWYMGSSGLGYLRAAQIGYVRVSRMGSYQVMAAIPFSEVFALRPWLMLAVSTAFLLLFAAVYLQASLLLKNVVVRRIEETNNTLSRITNGDLDQQVDVSEPVEFARLSSGINATVGSLKNAIAAESARIERDLATAKAIQESALPSTFPPFPDISSFDIYASMTPAREVGGDFYDFFLIDEHTLGFLIADVSGKGIPAALFMMAAKTELANYMSAGTDLAEAVQTANWHLCQGNDADMFVTVWAATLDWTTGELTYVNAGHNPPLLRHNRTWRWLTTKGGLFLGTFDTAKYRSSSLMLSPGDQILLYTDGVNEAMSVVEEQYGDQRLEEFVSAHSDLHPHKLIEELRSDVHAWAIHTEQSDDITMLSLEYGVSPEVGGTLTVPATLDYLDNVFALIHDELGKRLCPIVTQNQLDIAIEELFVNVCNYAYADDEEPGMCQIDYIYNANPSTITVSITDWGVPFNPLDQDDPLMPTSLADAKIGGLGIFMATRMTDDISYVRDGDANVVAFKKSWQQRSKDTTARRR